MKIYCSVQDICSLHKTNAPEKLFGSLAGPRGEDIKGVRQDLYSIKYLFAQAYPEGCTDAVHKQQQKGENDLVCTRM